VRRGPRSACSLGRLHAQLDSKQAQIISQEAANLSSVAPKSLICRKKKRGQNIERNGIKRIPRSNLEPTSE